MALDMTKDTVKVTVNERVVAQYTYVGNCCLCGLRLFHCATHPDRADHLMGNHLVVYVPGAPTEPPQMYCQGHDPNVALKVIKPQTDEFGRPLVIGDQYTPGYQRG